MIWNKVIAFLSMGRLALPPLAGFAEALSIYRREICNERHDLPLIGNDDTTYLALQNYKLFCKEIAEEHEELTGSGGLLGQNAYSST